MAETKARREEPARLAQQQEELEAWATKVMAERAASPDPPAPTRYGKTLSPAEQAHEAALEAEFVARNRAAAAKAFCTVCKVVGDCGEHG